MVHSAFLAKTSCRHCAHEAQPSFSGPPSPMRPRYGLHPQPLARRRGMEHGCQGNIIRERRTVVVVGKLTERSCYLGKTVVLDGWQHGRYLKTAYDQAGNKHDGFSLLGALLIKRLLTTVLQSQWTLTSKLDHLLHARFPHPYIEPACTSVRLGFIHKCSYF